MMNRFSRRIHGFCLMRNKPAIVLFALVISLFGSTAAQARGAVQKDETLTTESGLKYKIIRHGNGPKAEPGKEIGLHGIGYFEDGKVFWNSRDDQSPFYFVLGRDRVIKGCSEGVALMRVGDRFLFTMKPDLAYGEKGRPGTIPPNSTLLFDYEILSVEDPRISIADPLAQAIKEKGIDRAVELYRTLKTTKETEFNFREDQLIRLGNRLMRDGQIVEAVRIMELNVSVFSRSSNAYFSLAEALSKAGRDQEALENYQNALELNPKNAGAAEKIKTLQKKERA